MTLEVFLAFEPTLAQLRSELATCDAQDSERLEAQVSTRIADLERQWTQGRLGWLTPAEAAQIAAELNATGAARASVEDLDGLHLVFRGGRLDVSVLPIDKTGPVAARDHWNWYVQTPAEEAALDQALSLPRRKVERRARPARARAERHEPIVLLSCDEVAARLGATAEQVQAMVSRNEFLPPVNIARLGKRWIARAVDAWLSGDCSSAAE